LRIWKMVEVLKKILVMMRNAVKIAKEAVWWRSWPTNEVNERLSCRVNDPCEVGNNAHCMRVRERSRLSKQGRITSLHHVVLKFENRVRVENHWRQLTKQKTWNGSEINSPQCENGSDFSFCGRIEKVRQPVKACDRQDYFRCFISIYAAYEKVVHASKVVDRQDDLSCFVSRCEILAKVTSGLKSSGFAPRFRVRQGSLRPDSAPLTLSKFSM
jgi:hypothetical protein